MKFAQKQRIKSRLDFGALDDATIEKMAAEEAEKENATGGAGASGADAGLDSDFVAALTRTAAGKTRGPPKKEATEERRPSGLKGRITAFFQRRHRAKKQKENVITDPEVLADIKGRVWAANPIKEGWLTKQGGNHKTWKKRWFILHKTRIWYFENERADNPIGWINLLQSTVNADSDVSQKNAFEVVTPQRTWVLSAETEGLKKSWVGAIQKRLGRGMPVGGVAMAFMGGMGSAPGLRSTAQPPAFKVKAKSGASASKGKTPAPAAAPVEKKKSRSRSNSASSRDKDKKKSEGSAPAAPAPPAIEDDQDWDSDDDLLSQAGGDEGDDGNESL